MSTATVAPPADREPELLGQTVVVIGGSAGIGLETARRARAEGANALLSEAIILAIHQGGWAHFSTPPSALAAAFTEARLSDGLQLPLPGHDVAISPRQS